jgi:PBP1b-binding outer membrane lipoprotein LpoB
MRRRALVCLVVCSVTLGSALSLVGCGKSYVRGEEEPRLDEMTMSLRFDRVDIEKLYRENISKLMDSPIVAEWKQKAQNGSAPVVAVFPIRNETSEHIRKPLGALVSKFETDLVNELPIDVVAYNRQDQLVREIKGQQTAAFDPGRLSEYGEQLGAQYFLTGKVYDVAERTDEGRRVQYFMFIQVLNVATGGIKFQAESSVTKALIK